jgi:hypothetical protein
MVARSSTLSSVYDIGAAPYRKGQVLHSVFAAADHGRALTGEYWAAWGLDDPAIDVGNELAEKHRRDWDEARRRKVLATAQKLVTNCAALCLDDLDKEGHYAKIDSETDRRQIAAFLKDRIQHTVPLLCKRLQIAQLPLQQP